VKKKWRVRVCVITKSGLFFIELNMCYEYDYTKTSHDSYNPGVAIVSYHMSPSFMQASSTVIMIVIVYNCSSPLFDYDFFLFLLRLLLLLVLVSIVSLRLVLLTSWLGQ
jgi:hypothetical protein